MVGLDKVGKVFTRGDFFLNPGDLLHSGGFEFLSHGRRDTGCPGGFEEGFKFALVHLVEGFIEKLVEWDVLEEMTGVLVCAEGRWGGVWGHGVEVILSFVSLA